MRLALSLGLLAGVVAYAGGPASIAAPILGASLPWIAMSLVVATLDRALMAGKWAYLLRSQGQPLSFLAAVRVYCWATLHGMVLPSTMGADALRAFQVTRRGRCGETVVASIVVERLVGFIASLGVGLAALWILQLGGIVDPRLAGLGGVVVLSLVGAAVLFRVSMHPRALAGLPHLLPARVAQSVSVRRLSSLQRSYARFGARRAVLTRFFGLTVLEQLVSIVFYWMTALAVGVEVSLWFMAGVLPLTLLIARLPVSFDGLGVFEAVFIALMSLGGISPAESTSIALVARALQIVSALPWSVAHSVTSSAWPRDAPVAHTADQSA